MLAVNQNSDGSSRTSLNIVFIHPDLGIGGAERLVVDAAVGLQERQRLLRLRLQAQRQSQQQSRPELIGHQVTIFTSHCDKTHCFEEVRDGTLDVRVRGNTVFPSTILNGRFHILLATLRQLHLIIATCISTREMTDLQPDIFFVDQLSACVPLLRLLNWWQGRGAKVLFYCHFPDQLLARRDESGGSVVFGLVKKYAYRWLFDWLEGWTMALSDQIVVNSRFTRGVVEELFGKPVLGKHAGKLRVVYPCVDTTVDDHQERKEGQRKKGGDRLWAGKKVLLSINRFERKKDVGLAIRAYHALQEEQRAKAILVIAGGYDPNNSENVQYHHELESLASSLSLSHTTISTTARTESTTKSTSPPGHHHLPDIPDSPSTKSKPPVILFLPSIPTPLKSTLLSHTSLLLYTPRNEHFGITPLEAMAANVAVLARDSGGPLETVVDGVTGFLRRGDADDQLDDELDDDGVGVGGWRAVIETVLRDDDEEEEEEDEEVGVGIVERMGRAGRRRVEADFSRRSMTQRFEAVFDEMRLGVGGDGTGTSREKGAAGTISGTTVDIRPLVLKEEKKKEEEEKEVKTKKKKKKTKKKKTKKKKTKKKKTKKKKKKKRVVLFQNPTI